MHQPRTASPPPAPASSNALAGESPLRARWTPARQRIFLVALLETGNVARAALAAGMSRSSAHRLRARLAGTTFVRQWDAAVAVHAQWLADSFAPQTAPAPASASARPVPVPAPSPAAAPAGRSAR